MKRALILAIPLLVTMGAACSSGDDEPEVTVPDVSIPDISIPDISIPDISIPDISIPDISIPDISIPDISIPDISISQESINDALTGLGLDDDQVQCLVDELGGGKIPQINDVMAVLGECNIELTDLRPGG